MALFTYPSTSASLPSGAATEAKQDSQITLLTSIDGKDFATQTTLASLEGKDFATQTTLAALEGKDFATQTTLASLEGKDFATQTTLAALNAKVTAADTTGKATEAKQDDAITQLTTIAGDTTSLDGKVTAVDTGNVTISSALPAGTNNIGDVDVVSLPALPAGTNNIGDVDVVSLPALPAGTNNIGDVDVASLPELPAGTNNIGDVDVASLPSLPAGTNNIGDVDVLTLPALPAGSNTIGNVNVNPITPVDFLDTGLLDASSTNIPTAGVSVVASLAAAVEELEIVEDIGEFMALTDGSDNILAYLPLGGGRVKVSIASSTALKLASLTGSSITTGNIAINFLG